MRWAWGGAAVLLVGVVVELARTVRSLPDHDAGAAATPPRPAK